MIVSTFSIVLSPLHWCEPFNAVLRAVQVLRHFRQVVYDRPRLFELCLAGRLESIVVQVVRHIIVVVSAVGELIVSSTVTFVVLVPERVALAVVGQAAFEQPNRRICWFV